MRIYHNNSHEDAIPDVKVLCPYFWEESQNEKTSKKESVCQVKFPEGNFCGHNCADGCIYWNPRDRDRNGRRYCSHYGSYYYPRERQGCLSYRG